MERFKNFSNVFSYKRIKHIGAREMTKNKGEINEFFSMLRLIPALMDTDIEFLKHKTKNTKDSRERKMRIDALSRHGLLKHKKGEEEEYVKRIDNMFYGKALTQIMSDKDLTDTAGDLGVLDEEKDWKDEKGWFWRMPL